MNESLQILKIQINKKRNQLYYIEHKDVIKKRSKKRYFRVGHKPWSERSDNPANIKLSCPKCQTKMICIYGNQNSKKYQCPLCTDMWTLSKSGIKK